MTPHAAELARTIKATPLILTAAARPTGRTRGFCTALPPLPMQAPGRGAVPYKRARELVNATVPQHVAAWAKIIGLQGTDAQFQEDVTEALHAFMRAHIATTSGRWRWSTVRKAFLDLAEDYTALAKLLRHWESGRALPPHRFDPLFKDLPPLWPDPPVLRTKLAPFDAARSKGLAKAAKGYAKACPLDKGGRVSPSASRRCLSGSLMRSSAQRNARPPSAAARLLAGGAGTSSRSSSRRFGRWRATSPKLSLEQPVELKLSTSDARGKRLQRLLVRVVPARQVPRRRQVRHLPRPGLREPQRPVVVAGLSGAGGRRQAEVERLARAPARTLGWRRVRAGTKAPVLFSVLSLATTRSRSHPSCGSKIHHRG